MDDNTTPSPPGRQEVAALAAQSLPQGAPPEDTLPTRPGAAAPTADSLPPTPRADAGQAMPPPPHTSDEITPALIAGESPGLGRAIAASNLDAVAQAPGAARPDRYSAESLQEMVEGGTVPVPVHQINRALIEIWKSTSAGGEHEGKVSVTLMRAMNLVVYVEDAARAQQVTDVISRVTGRHPCRTTMIVNRCGPVPATPAPPSAAPAPDSGLDVTMSAHCQLASASGKRVCCEQVTIAADSPAMLYRASTLALNLLITDLPVFLWWAGGAPVNSVVLANLDDSIDRLVVDSQAFPDPLAGLLALARASDATVPDHTGARYAPSDLNWDRLAAWREATAYSFDLPAYAASLWRIGSVEVQYAEAEAGEEPNPVAALLYTGWLATRLNWEFHTAAPLGGRGGPGDYVLTLHQGMRSIPVILRAVPPDVPGRRGLVSVRLITNDVNPVTFRMSMATEDVFVDCVVVPEGGAPEIHKVRYTLNDEASLLDSALEAFGHDPIYEQALLQAGTMAWASLPLRRRADLSAQFGSEQRSSSFDPRF